ncbi:hypothetical protein ET475_08185 [Microbacterium protaetiae]|uniref:Uncharacterized protein n=1 Tax=Microbacterium protaetiae TaxID=2509458 RepID=A0A4P6ECL0_9MICO|nr:hypothetical protein [Microbacterium protaetiae]QAY59975.1 hypothetical protein ET475_08185 [Microbacterium protaetiae]
MVVAVALAATSTVMLARDGGIYTSRTIVVLTWPGSTAVSPYNGTNDWSVITFAEAVTTIVNGGKTDTQYYSHVDAPLYGVGVRQASTVTVRDEGSQWVSDIDSAVIEVQVVGRTHDWVETRQQALLDKIEEVAVAEQGGDEVPADEKIAVHVESLTKEIAYVSASRMAKILAAMALFGTALILGGAIAWVTDRRSVRRHQSGAESSTHRHEGELSGAMAQ